MQFRLLQDCVGYLFSLLWGDRPLICGTCVPEQSEIEISSVLDISAAW